MVSALLRLSNSHSAGCLPIRGNFVVYRGAAQRAMREPKTKCESPDCNNCLLRRLVWDSINFDQNAAEKGHIFPVGRERDGGVTVVVQWFLLARLPMKLRE